MSDGKPLDGSQASQPTQGARRSPTIRPLWRGGWLRRTPVVAALFVLVATGALAIARYTLTPPVYVASQTLAIVVTLPNSSTTTSSYDQSMGAQQEVAIAQLITTPTFLGASAFEGDVVMRLQGQPGDATTRNATAAQIGQALSAQLSGQGAAQVTLTARWATATGAQAVLAATVAALQFDATQLVQGVVAVPESSVTPTTSDATPTTSATPAVSAPITPPLASGELIGAQGVTAPSTAVRDPASASAARQRLYEQLALAFIVAILLGGAIQWALTRRPQRSVAGAPA